MNIGTNTIRSAASYAFQYHSRRDFFHFASQAQRNSILKEIISKQFKMVSMHSKSFTSKQETIFVLAFLKCMENYLCLLKNKKKYVLTKAEKTCASENVHVTTESND